MLSREGTSDALLTRMILFEIGIWFGLGMIVGLSITYFNLWRGRIWQIAVLGGASAIVGGLLFKIIPGSSIDDFDVLALIGALLFASVTIAVVARRTGRALPMS